MFVANRMTKNPVTIAPDASLDDAFLAMKKGNFRRLPVVEDGKLVGFFSDKDLMRVAPSPATTLSRYEEKSLLDKLKVAEIMNKNVISVQEDATIEEAALIMYDKKIGGLPVISEVGAVVGVITETDIFKTFVDVMALSGGKTRLTVLVDNKVGVVNEISGIFAAEGLSIDSLVTCKQEDGSYEIVIRGIIPDVESIKKSIEEKGYKVIHSVKFE
ncbi:acetoin utilization protein AcuB [Selenomonas sp. WCT3]|uniref:CBS and ACT domain-containing protein n=1 Tax=unclassified Selenomonas TaxID=2637378 RepID=UPI00088AB915|nr:CBS and ACT domain-containing protein [Selenomonas sp.]MCR5440192.1 CBS and ACT domain-containing protein [Selenomonas sp.]MDD6135432.1 CBS and ACT domain-containing protein [Selenomonadaceae bacterium]SDG85613.1 acetoin utilization protein AcuB [Selenomonas ruminantium]